MAFRKRILHRGSTIGYHLQDFDEVYYILSGTGEYTLNGTRRQVGPGTAMLTRPGVARSSTHRRWRVGSHHCVPGTSSVDREQAARRPNIEVEPEFVID